MPAPSKIKSLLPDQMQAELNRRIKENGFGGYRDLSEWLQEEGYAISKSAVHSYGQKLEAQVAKIRAATEQADYIRTAFPDDDAGMMDGILRTYISEIFNYMQDFELNPGQIDPAKLGKILGDLSRAMVSQKRLAKDIREEERMLAAETVSSVGTAQGLSKEVIAEMRAKVLGQ